MQARSFVIRVVHGYLWAGDHRSQSRGGSTSGFRLQIVLCVFSNFVSSNPERGCDVARDEHDLQTSSFTIDQICSLE